MSRDHLGPPCSPYEAALDAIATFNASVDPLYLMRLRVGLHDGEVAYIKARGTELRRGIAEVAEAEGRN